MQSFKQQRQHPIILKNPTIHTTHFRCYWSDQFKTCNIIKFTAFYNLSLKNLEYFNILKL